MLKKLIASILIPGLLMQVLGCYSEYLTAKKNLKTEPYDMWVVTKDKKEYSRTKRCWETKNDTLIIYNVQLKPQQKIPFNLIDEIYLKKIDPVKTTVLTAAVIIFCALIYSAIKNIRFNILGDPSTGHNFIF